MQQSELRIHRYEATKTTQQTHTYYTFKKGQQEAAHRSLLCAVSRVCATTLNIAKDLYENTVHALTLAFAASTPSCHPLLDGQVLL